MRTTQHTNPLRHALLWIGTYVVVATISDGAAEAFGLPGLTAVVLAAFAVALLLYLRATSSAPFYGIRRVGPGTLPRVLFFIPLFAIATLQFVTGTAPGLTVGGIAFIVLLVSAVGLLEEVIFRGFLLQALQSRGGLTRAIIISGLTFGFGHVVNILRGASTGVDQLLQIVAATLIGIALSYCVVLTGSILPGVVIHATFNLSGLLTAHSTASDILIVALIALISAAYIPILHKQLVSHGPAIRPAIRPRLPAGP